MEDNTLIICENNTKVGILKKMSNKHLFLNVKFITKKEFLNSFLFKLKDNALYEIVNKYNLKIDIAKMYLENIYYIEDKKYNNEKLDFLYELKTFLKDNNLLEYDNTFKDYLKNFNIQVIGYDYLETFEEEIFNSLNAKIINEDLGYELPCVLEFASIEEEINYVLKDIAIKIESGIDINKIKLVNVTDEYYIPLARIAKFYNLNINIPKTNNLYSSSITKEFLKYYDSNLEDAFNKIKGKNFNIVNKIVSIVNKYTYEEDKLKVKDFIIHDLKNTKINNFNLKDYIELSSITDSFEDEYVYLLGFNMGSIPTAIKDESYITDNIKDLVKLKKTNIINKEVKENLIKRLRSIKNLIISYKLKTSSGDTYASPLISELNLNVERKEIDIKDSYSLMNDKINYTKLLDSFFKYGKYDSNINIYKNSLNIPYNKFDNKFKGIETSDLKEYLNNKLTISYSSLNTYNECAFRYYLNNILKIDKYEDKFEAFIGSIFHDVLEKCFDEKLDIDKEVEDYIINDKRELSTKERFFVDKVKEDIKYTVNVIKKKNELISMKHGLYEQNVSIDKSKNGVDVKFTGFIDKLLYEDFNDCTLVSIIDYKTGLVDIELKYLEYGFSMQLPIYLYLVKRGNLFKNPKFVGFYLQMILNKDITIAPNKTYDEQREDNLKLNGYSLNDQDILEKFDSSYAKSELIKSMSVKADGDFGAYAKILSEEQINRIIELTEDNVNKGIDNILNGKFDINPKKIGYNKLDGCNFCKFKDICYKKEKDYVLLEDKKDISFLGDDENA